MGNRYGLTWQNLVHPLRSLLCDKPFPGLGFRLGLGAHDTTTPLLPDLIEFVVEVGLKLVSTISRQTRSKDGNEENSPTNLNSLKDLAELKFILVLHCGQAQNRGSLLVNDL